MSQDRLPTDREGPPLSGKTYWRSLDELAELFTHLAFYAGWPSAMTAVTIAMEVLAETE